MMQIGIKKISENDTNLNMFLVWSSTSDISSLAPHHEFCPIVWRRQITKEKNYLTDNE